MQKSPQDKPLNALARNVGDLRKQLDYSHADIDSILRNSGRQKGIAKTVSNIEREVHSVGVGNVADVAQALQVPMWQLFIQGLPVNARARNQLTKLVRAFVMLENPEHRDRLVADAELVCLAEEKLERLKRETGS